MASAVAAKFGNNTGSTDGTPPAGSVTLAQMANLAANSLIGNTTGSAATPTTVPTSTFVASTSLLRSYLATTVTYNANAVLANTPLSVTVAAGGRASCAFNECGKGVEYGLCGDGDDS